MILKSLFLQNFRNYKKAEFEFEDNVAVVIGANASGKSSMLEAIYALSAGQGVNGERDRQMVNFEEEFCRARGEVIAGRGEESFEGELELVFAKVNGVFRKKYLVNKIGKRRVDFAGRLVCVEFSPDDLEIVEGQPGKRRRFLDEILEQTDSDYRMALATYNRALRQRNSLLERAKKNGQAQRESFGYWNDMLIKNGNVITQRRGGLIDYMNRAEKSLFSFKLEYDKSEITQERLEQYESAEIGAGVTLIGPQRDEIRILSKIKRESDIAEVKYFFSRGQRRLVVLGLKLLHIKYIEMTKSVKPVLLLDDIFSELDEVNIGHVLGIIGGRQVIVTTTHEDFVPIQLRSSKTCIRLEK